MIYEITIRKLEEYTTEEELNNRDRNNRQTYPGDRDRFSDRNFHETRVLHAEVSKEEFEAVKKAIISVL